jgi:DGQHR domain-containing protein
MATAKKLLKFKCIPIKQGAFTLYAFAADAKSLWSVVEINRREDDKELSYQRILSPSRRRAIARYIDQGRTIPTAVIVSFDADTKISSDGEFVVVPNRPKAGWVIDGQHRLAGAHESKKPIELPVVAFLGLDVEAQIEQFVTINREAKGVPTSLYYDLLKNLPLKSSTDVAKEKAADICAQLKIDESSPFFGRIVVTTAPSKGELSLNNFVRKLYPLLLDKGPLSVYSAPEQALIIDNYFAGLRVVFPQLFNKSSIFFSTIGFGGVINALPTALNLCVKNYKAFKVSDVSKLFTEVKDFDFLGWQKIGTGSAAEIQAGEDLKQTLINAFSDGGAAGASTIDLGQS